MFKALIVITFLLSTPSIVSATSIPEAQAVRAIIGEASGEGYEGMLAVAGALRNRGHLKGVYGIKAKHVDQQPKWVWDLARKAWRNSAFTDTSKGADHWHNLGREGETYWTRVYAKTAKVGKHVFYTSKTRVRGDLARKRGVK